MKNPLLFLSLALAGLAMVQALPSLAHNARADLDPANFRITLGPGLPSLESLNLTIADLMDPEFLTKRGLPAIEAPGLIARQTPDCYTGPNFGEYSQLQWCYNLLMASDDYCTARYAEHTVFCTVDGLNGFNKLSSWIVGDVVGGTSQTTTSSCADVAYGAAVAMYGCARSRTCAGLPGTFIGGAWPARGNGNLDVVVGGQWGC